MQRRLSIAFVSETYPPEVNGVARTVASVISGLRARGHEIRLVRPRQGPGDRASVASDFGEMLRPGMPIPRYAQLRMGLPSRRALLDAWQRSRPDIVHIATEGPLGWSALSAARSLEIPAASDFRTNFHAYSSHYGFGWVAGAVVAYLRLFHNRADCTMVPTEEMARGLQRLGFGRLRVVGRGVNAAVFSPQKRDPALRRQWCAPEDTPVALCVSRFAPEKNFPLLLDAYRAMRAAQPETRLVLVGDGPMAGELQRSLSGEMRGIVVAGHLDDDEIAAHYASADIFLFPSVTETFGNVTLEAMASGLAVVACDYAAARQYIVHGRSGLLAPVGEHGAFVESAAALARDLPRARALGRRAREVVAPLGWHRIVEEFEEVLLETIAARAEGRQGTRAAA